MIRERIIRLFAGTLILIGSGLGAAVNHWWFALAAFVGLNLFQSGLTGWCLLDDILRRRFGVPSEADLLCRAGSGTKHSKPAQ